MRGMNLIDPFHELLCIGVDLPVQFISFGLSRLLVVIVFAGKDTRTVFHQFFVARCSLSFHGKNLRFPFQRNLNALSSFQGPPSLPCQAIFAALTGECDVGKILQFF